MQNQYNLLRRQDERELLPMCADMGVGAVPYHLRARDAWLVADAWGASMAQVALAWVLASPFVSAPIVGATKPHHLPEAVAAFDLHLSEDELQALEEPYTPQGRSWFQETVTQRRVTGKGQ